MFHTLTGFQISTQFTVYTMSLILNALARVLPTRAFRSQSPEETVLGQNKTDPPLEEKVDIVSAPPPVTKKGGEGQARQEQIIREKLARFARLPAYSVFESVIFLAF
jgi:hypothetical protein